ncbi:unnamed protein product [Phytophthora fragariaefolia]|uniref:Unnamed protein product n=1 Tax=Phytophthora fragariaefolia TaxID=1490495 RepID=A0A9W6XK23_9STRA|nr:unnamed protein product [Phytophthora fragariaefolia]
MDCRTTHSSHEVVFKVAEGYAVLRERLKRLLTGESAVTWDADTGIYMKATVNARQRLDAPRTFATIATSMS